MFRLASPILKLISSLTTTARILILTEASRSVLSTLLFLNMIAFVTDDANRFCSLDRVDVTAFHFIDPSTLVVLEKIGILWTFLTDPKEVISLAS